MTCLSYWKGRQHLRWIAVTEQQLGYVSSIAGRRADAVRYLRSSLNDFQAVADKLGSASATNQLLQVNQNL